MHVPTSCYGSVVAFAMGTNSILMRRCSLCRLIPLVLRDGVAWRWHLQKLMATMEADLAEDLKTAGEVCVFCV